MASWSNLFWLICSIILLLFLNRWIILHIQGVGLLLSNSKATAIWLYFFLFLPGILVHEISHYLMARLLQVQVGKLSLWPRSKGRSQVILGSVEVRGAGPLRHSLIGAAPFMAGLTIILFLSQRLYLDRLGTAFLSGDVEIFLSALYQSLSIPDFWLWFYLLFVVVNTMLPSPADRLYWTPVLLFFGTISLLLVGLDLLPYKLIISQSKLPNLLAWLSLTMLTAVVVNAFFISCIFIVEILINTTMGRKINY